MAISTAVRLVAGLLTFSVVARLLGPQAFGVLMLWLSVSTLLSLVTNYGLTTYVLREIGASPASAESIINEGMTGKLLLSAVVFACAIVAAWGLRLEFKQVFLCLLVASVADTFGEFLNAGFRARDRFDVEAKIATITSLTHAAIVVGTVVAYSSVEMAAGAHLASRLVALAITVPAVAKHFAAPKLADFGASITRLRMAISYAADFGFQSLFGQIDSVVLNYFLGPAAVGLYQAGMRIFLGGTQAASVLSNVFLPRASSSHKLARLFAVENRRLQLAFISIGAFFGLIMAAYSQPIVGLLYGSSYFALVDLMPLFGLLFFLRFSAGAWGIVLTAAGEQSYRTKLGILYWVLVFPMAILLVPAFGSSGWLSALCISSVLLIVGYGLRARRYLTKYWGVAGLSLLAGLAFLPFIIFI